MKFLYRGIASLTVPEWAKVPLSSFFFLQISIIFVLFFLHFPHFCPYFGPTGGSVAPPQMWKALKTPQFFCTKKCECNLISGSTLTCRNGFWEDLDSVSEQGHTKHSNMGKSCTKHILWCILDILIPISPARGPM